MNTFPWKSLPASLALLLAGYSLLGQGVPVPPNPPVRPPETPEQRAAREAAHQARLAANRVRFDPWLAFPMTLADGSPANRDSIDADTRARLLALADELRVKYGAMRAEMQRRGIPTRITFANGEVGEVRLEGNSISILANDDIEGADTISTDELWPAGSTGLALNGTNTVVGIWEVGGIPRTNHLELNGRVVDREGGNPATSHGTGVGSVIAAAGVASPVFGGITYTNGARGMSFAATLWARNTESNIVELATESAAGLLISNHSYSTTCGWRPDGANWIWYGSTNISQTEDWKFGAYTDDTRAVDDTARTSLRHLLVWTPGNSRGEVPATQPINHFLAQVTTNGQVSFTPITNNPPVRSMDGDAGGYDSLHPLGTGKNVLTAGAANFIAGGYTNAAQVVLGSFSPYGPTDDGRIKPDLVAQGVGVVMANSQNTNVYQRSSGTSYAAPAITGSLNLLAQRRTQLHPNARPWLASSQKVLALHTADEAGEHPGPDFRHGWGLMNTRRAAGLLGANATNGWKSFLKEMLLLHGEFIEFPVTALGGTNQLKLTMCWTDPAGPAQTEQLDPTVLRLVNDLDLRVIAPNGTTNFPWVLNPDLVGKNPTNRAAAATRGDNTRDNVEQVVITNAVAGTYRVQVTHKGTLQNEEPQWVSLAMSGITGQAKPVLAITETALLATNRLAFKWPAVPGQLYQLQWRPAFGAGAWTDLGGEISATQTNAAVEILLGTEPRGFFRVTERE